MSAAIVLDGDVGIDGAQTPIPARHVSKVGSVRRVRAFHPHGQGERGGEPSRGRDGVKPLKTRIAAARGAEQDALAVVRPADGHIGAGMVGEAARFTARGGDHVDVIVPIVIARIGDHGSIRRKDRMAQDAGARHQALGVAARSIDNPDVSSEGESNLGLAERGTLQEQRPGIRREREDGRENHEEACQQ